MTLNAGDRLLNYEIIAPLGKGGFGTVYLARDVNLEINVAVKVMHTELSNSETMLHRLKVGARAAARLRHPNIQAIYYLGRDPAAQVDFVVMEYLSGGTLRQKITFGPLAPGEALATFTTICDAVDFAHRNGVIHRDLKPDNIMYDASGKLVVTDFDLARVTGQARRTAVGQTFGTLLYLSPEQALGEEVDHTADIYSLGVMLFELLTGRWPFMGADDLEILDGHLNKPPPRPSSLNPAVPPYLDEAVLGALEKKPAGRFQSAHELADAANARGSQPVIPVPPHVSEAEVVASVVPTRVGTKPQRRAALRIVKGALAGQCLTLGPGTAIGYGRKKNDLHLDDEYVSRAHARIDRQADTYQLMDLKSKNGTKVNGTRLEPYAPLPLANGDTLEMGDTVLVFEMSVG
jgi:serine/threonine protein kinase